MRSLRTVGIGVALTGIVVAGGYTSYALLAPLDPVTATVQPLPEISTPPAEVDLPEYGAWAVGAADSDQIYAGRDVDTPLPMASIAKVVNALVVLDAHPIPEGETGAAITLSERDSRLTAEYQAINGSVAPAPAGLTVSQRDVVALMMVQSANNYAETLALWAFGTETAYLEAARRWLDAHDLTGISIADTTGFNPENRASARNLVALARLAVAHPVIAATAALPVLDVAGVGQFENRNLALGLAGVDGLKTGTLRVIGSNLLFSADLPLDDGTAAVVGVAIGAPDQTAIATDLERLLLSLRDDFHDVQLGEAGSTIARYTTPWGDSAELRLAETSTDRVWGPTRSVAFVSAPDLQPGLAPPAAPVMTVRYGDRQVELTLEWSGVLERPPLDWLLRQPLENLVRTE